MSHILLSFLFYNVILLIFYSHYRRGHYYIKKKHLVFYTALLIAFGTYGGGEGDYLHYRERMTLFQSLYDVLYYDMMEVQYNYLAYLVNGNYNLWRLVIFSVQFIGMSWFLYKAKLNTYPVYLCFITYLLISSVYNRSYWGPIYYFMGIYLLLEKKNPLFLIAIALNYFSHTQNIVLFALLPLAFFDLKKWHLISSVLLFGIVVIVIRDVFTSILDTGGIVGGIESGDYINKKAQEYSEGKLGAFGNSIGEYIMFIFRYVPMAVIVLTWLNLIFNHHNKYLSFYKPLRRVLNIAISVVLLSLIVLFANIGGGTFFYRILAMALFPLCIILPSMVKNGTLSKKSFNFYILIFIIGSELSYLKDLYYAYAGGNY